MFCFPDVEEVHLKDSPLDEVICQVRFPAILRISREVPVDFQERIRADFPETKVGHEMSLQFNVSDPTQPAAKPSLPIFKFGSGDGATSVSLSSGFYALSTRKYTHWHEFRGLLQKVTAAAREVYDIPYATRAGLRYVNRLTYQNTHVRSVEALWHVLRPELTSLLRADCWTDPVQLLSQLALTGEDDLKLTLRSGYEGDGTGGPTFVLDFDVYAEGHRSLDHIQALVDSFHDVIRRAFRWCIAEGSLQVFGPQQESV